MDEVLEQPRPLKLIVALPKMSVHMDSVQSVGNQGDSIGPDSDEKMLKLQATLESQNLVKM